MNNVHTLTTPQAATAASVSLALPVPHVTQEDLNTWYTLQKELERVKTAELEMRKKIFAAYFANPKEGTNTVPLSEGWVMKGMHKINRSVDIALLTTHAAMLNEQQVPVDALLKYKPELVTAAYRALTDEQRKLFDLVLDIKLGTPALEVVLPKKNT